MVDKPAVTPLNVDDRSCLDFPEYVNFTCTCWRTGTLACPLTQPAFCRNCTKARAVRRTMTAQRPPGAAPMWALPEFHRPGWRADAAAPLPTIPKNQDWAKPIGYGVNRVPAVSEGRLLPAPARGPQMPRLKASTGTTVFSLYSQPMLRRTHLASQP